MNKLTPITIEFYDIMKDALPDNPGSYLVAWSDGTVETYNIDEEEIAKGFIVFEDWHFEGRSKVYTGVTDATHWAFQPDHPNPEIQAKRRDNDR